MPRSKSLYLIVLFIWVTLMSGCVIMRENSKYKFNDGVYNTKRIAPDKVYVLHIDDDTLAIFPVLEFPDSTAIQTNKKVVYTSQQRKFKDKKMARIFYKPSADVDVMSIPVKYRPYTEGFPNQLTANFNGALFGGYRIDEYKLTYKRTPLNVYKQNVRHRGYSAGLYAGIGSSLINDHVLDKPNVNIEYEGVTFCYGLSLNMAADKVSFGVSLGFDHLLDKYSDYWIYERKPYIGFTLGLDIN